MEPSVATALGVIWWPSTSPRALLTTWKKSVASLGRWAGVPIPASTSAIRGAPINVLGWLRSGTSSSSPPTPPTAVSPERSCSRPTTARSRRGRCVARPGASLIRNSARQQVVREQLVRRREGIEQTLVDHEAGELPPPLGVHERVRFAFLAGKQNRKRLFDLGSRQPRVDVLVGVEQGLRGSGRVLGRVARPALQRGKEEADRLRVLGHPLLARHQDQLVVGGDPELVDRNHGGIVAALL